jgi:hypothetical protein
MMNECPTNKVIFEHGLVKQELNTIEDRPALAKSKIPSQNSQNKEDWRYGSYSKSPVKQAQSPEF